MEFRLRFLQIVAATQKKKDAFKLVWTFNQYKAMSKQLLSVLQKHVLSFRYV